MSDFLEPHSAPHPAHAPRPRPLPWRQFRATFRPPWALPFLYLDWLSQWTTYVFSQASFFELLEYAGRLSILIAVIFYFWEAPERQKLKHYQAWQVINTAQGKGGSGGRIDALHDLNDDHVPLVGVDVSDAFLQGVQLAKADLGRADFSSADLRNADLQQTNLEQTNFSSANLRQANLSSANLTDARFSDTDMTDANLTNANLHAVDFSHADLRGVDLANAQDWKSITKWTFANIHGLRNAPDGLTAWALQNGAMDAATDEEWTKQMSTTQLFH